ncbi:hypothetical protein DFQ28_009787 [Apophysomyces sp. BC1034]|nr:hypothetical protein DFQ30_001722 [Apophysomyces sp. BC1015]KAG0194579.1 hypothetical protein DFQ28_009787 [Apophysomyces sp. BC1034]
MAPLPILSQGGIDTSLSYATVVNNIKELRDNDVPFNVDAFIESEGIKLSWQDAEPNSTDPVAANNVLETLRSMCASKDTPCASPLVHAQTRDLTKEFLAMNEKMPQLRSQITHVLDDIDSVQKALQKTTVEIQKGP